MKDVNELWSELEKRGLKAVKRAHYQNNEWDRESMMGIRVGGWISLKEAEAAQSRAMRAEIVSYVAIAIAVASLFFSWLK